MMKLSDIDEVVRLRKERNALQIDRARAVGPLLKRYEIRDFDCCEKLAIFSLDRGPADESETFQILQSTLEEFYSRRLATNAAALKDLGVIIDEE
jgi:hypothetical protein